MIESLTMTVLPIHPCAGKIMPTTANGASNKSLEQLKFIANWQTTIQPRLTQLLIHLQQQTHVSSSIALAQIWTYLPVLMENKQMIQADPLCLLGDPRLQPFHASSSHQGVQLNLLGPMSLVWEHGVVQVVQDLTNLSLDTHPCNMLDPGLQSAIAETLYLPVYDAPFLPSSAPPPPPSSAAASAVVAVTPGVVAVLEIMIAKGANDTMVVANTISSISDIMQHLSLSVSNPLQNGHNDHNNNYNNTNGIFPSVVAGRNASSSSTDPFHTRPLQKQQQQQQENHHQQHRLVAALPDNQHHLLHRGGGPLSNAESSSTNTSLMAGGIYSSPERYIPVRRRSNGGGGGGGMQRSASVTSIAFFSPSP